MTGLRRTCLGLCWGLCAIGVVALYASLAAQFVGAAGGTLVHWAEHAEGDYAAFYAPMRGH